MSLDIILSTRLDMLVFFALGMLLMAVGNFFCRRNSKSKGFGPFVWAIWFFAMAAAVFLSERTAEDEKEQITSMIEGVVPTYAQELERLGHEKISWQTSPEDPVYLSIIEAEKRWLKVNQAVSDIYTFGRGKDGRAVLLVDSETDYNRSGSYDEDRERRTAIGELFPLQNEPVQKALAGEPNFDGHPYTDRWGTWVTMYYPLRDSMGRPQGALGIDYSAQSWLFEIFMRRVSVFGLSLLAVFALAGFSVMDSRLRSKDRYLKALIENAQDVVTVLDAKGKVLYESPSLQTVAGHRPEELVGKMAFDFIHPEDVSGVLDVFSRVLSSPGMRHSVQFRFRHKDGSWIFMESIACSLISDPAVRGVIVNSRDMTANKKTQEELEQQRISLLQHSKMASLGEMAGGIAHEINTPLSIIMGYSDQLNKSVNSCNFNESLLKMCASNISDMAARIAGIVRSLRSFSRDASRDPFTRTLLRTLVEDTTAICSERFRKHNVALEIHKLPEAILECRPAELVQVLLNLFSNAMDAVEPMSEKRVELKAIDHGSDIEIQITDSGPGIPPSLKEKIFEPFFTTKEVGKGTGLGLSICRNIIESHDGTFSLLELPRGAGFSIRLPKQHIEGRRAA